MHPPTRVILKDLEAPYRDRAVPPGSVRYWSWLFASAEARPPLLGVYALMAEWRALMDPTTERSVAVAKLSWWEDELRRLSSGAPLHPITQYLAALPGKASWASHRLAESVTAAAAQVAGAPLEHAGELEVHAHALYGIPLLTAAEWERPSLGGADVERCIAALAAAEYLARALADYGRDARAGRVPFPVEQLLNAGIDNDDLAATNPPQRLRLYLDQLHSQAAHHFHTAAGALPAAERAPLRHLAVLSALGLKALAQGRAPSRADFRLADLYNAWNAARRAAAAR